MSTRDKFYMSDLRAMYLAGSGTFDVRPLIFYYCRVSDRKLSWSLLEQLFYGNVLIGDIVKEQS